MLSLEKIINEVFDFLKKFVNTLYFTVFHPIKTLYRVIGHNEANFVNPRLYFFTSLFIFVQYIFTSISRNYYEYYSFDRFENFIKSVLNLNITENLLIAIPLFLIFLFYIKLYAYIIKFSLEEKEILVNYLLLWCGSSLLYEVIVNLFRLFLNLFLRNLEYLGWTIFIDYKDDIMRNLIYIARGNQLVLTTIAFITLYILFKKKFRIFIKLLIIPFTIFFINNVIYNILDSGRYFIENTRNKSEITFKDTLQIYNYDKKQLLGENFREGLIVNVDTSNYNLYTNIFLHNTSNEPLILVYPFTLRIFHPKPDFDAIDLEFYDTKEVSDIYHNYGFNNIPIKIKPKEAIYLQLVYKNYEKLNKKSFNKFFPFNKSNNYYLEFTMFFPEYHIYNSQVYILQDRLKRKH